MRDTYVEQQMVRAHASMNMAREDFRMDRLKRGIEQLSYAKQDVEDALDRATTRKEMDDTRPSCC